jgi:hypothetical protein
MTALSDELSIYNAAKELAKKLLISNLIEKIASNDFDAINFCHLLSQDEGGENGANPLHGIFPQESIAHARKFLAAQELLDQYYASIPEDPEAPIEPEEINENMEKNEQE